MKGAMHCIRRYFLEQPVEQEDHLLTMIEQIVIAKHNKRAGKPLIEHSYRSDGSPNPSNKFMIFLPGLAQIHQLCEMIRRALALLLAGATNHITAGILVPLLSFALVLAFRLFCCSFSLFVFSLGAFRLLSVPPAVLGKIDQFTASAAFGFIPA